MRAPRRIKPQPKRSLGIRPATVLLAVVGGLIAVIWIGPRLFDWSTHREAIEAAASGFIGRDVQISGPIRLSLLPQPSITAEKVEVRDDGDGVRMGTRALTLNLSLGALLTGSVAVTHVTLDRPDIRLPWPLPNGPISIEPPPWLASLSADVTHGSLRMGPLRVTDADISVITGGPDAAVHIDGTATAGGIPWQVGVDLAWPQGDGSAGLHIALQDTGTPASSFDIKGSMAADGTVAGRFTAHGADLSAILPAPALPFDTAGLLHADGRSIRLSDLGLTLGNMPATGDVQLRVSPAQASLATTPSIVVSLHAPMLDLAPWLKAFPKASASAPPLALDLDADAAIFGDGLLRRFGLKLVTSASRIRVDDLHATLPGEAALVLAGFYDPAALSFAGKMRLGAPSPAVTLHWLAQSKLLPDFSAPLAGLSSLAITADVIADPRHTAITGIDGRMNDTTIAGGLVLGLGSQPSVSAGLSFGKIDLGQWLPPGWFINPPRPDILAGDLAGMTADLRLFADEVWFGDERIDHAVLDTAITNGSLNVRRFAGEDRGLQVLGSGAMDSKGTLRNARLVLAAPHASPFLALVPARLRGQPAFWTAPLTAVLTAAGPPTALALSLQGTLGDLGFSAQPVMDLVHDHWQGAITLRHPNASRLLSAIGFTSAAAWLGPGSLSVVANTASDGSGWSVAPLTFSLGLLRGSGKLARPPNGPPDERKIVGTLAIDTLPWPEPETDDPIPLDLLRGWQATLGITVNKIVDDLTPVATDLRTYADVTNGVLRVAIEGARVLGGSATGAFRLDTADPPHMTADLSLSGAHLTTGAQPTAQDPWPVSMTAKDLSGQAMIDARGYSLASWLASATGKVSLTASHGALSGLDLTAVAAPQPGSVAHAKTTALFAGQTPFDSLTSNASLAQGDLHLGEFQLSGEAGSLTAGGEIDIVRGVCNLTLALKPTGSSLPSDAVLRGPLRSPAWWIVRGAPAN